MEGLKSEEDWKGWAFNATWRPMPPGQSLRHRCSQGVLFLGNGGTQTWKYNEYGSHDNLSLVPTWTMPLVRVVLRKISLIFFVRTFVLLN